MPTILQQSPASAPPPAEPPGRQAHDQRDDQHDRGCRQQLAGVVAQQVRQRTGQVGADSPLLRLAGHRYIGRRVERLPTALRKPDLDPRMGITAAHVPDARDPVAFARHVSACQPGRHALCAQHDRQRRRDLLAEASS